MSEYGKYPIPDEGIPERERTLPAGVIAEERAALANVNGLRDAALNHNAMLNDKLADNARAALSKLASESPFAAYRILGRNLLAQFDDHMNNGLGGRELKGERRTG